MGDLTKKLLHIGGNTLFALTAGAAAGIGGYMAYKGISDNSFNGTVRSIETAAGVAIAYTSAVYTSGYIGEVIRGAKQAINGNYEIDSEVGEFIVD